MQDSNLFNDPKYCSQLPVSNIWQSKQEPEVIDSPLLPKMAETKPTREPDQQPEIKDPEPKQTIKVAECALLK